MASISRLFDRSKWTDPSQIRTLIRPLPTHLATNGENPHASAALADFDFVEEGGRPDGRWKRKQAADFRIPKYQNFLMRNTEEKGGRPVPEEPGVCDKALSRVQIRLDLPNPEIPSCLRQEGVGGVLPLHRDVPSVAEDIPFDGLSQGFGLDLRKLTGHGLRTRIARALGLPEKNVRLSLEGEEGTEVDVLDGCMLSAYARQLGGGGLALRLSLDPG